MNPLLQSLSASFGAGHDGNTSPPVLEMVDGCWQSIARSWPLWAKSHFKTQFTRISRSPPAILHQLQLSQKLKPPPQISFFPRAPSRAHGGTPRHCLVTFWQSPRPFLQAWAASPWSSAEQTVLIPQSVLFLFAHVPSTTLGLRTDCKTQQGMPLLAHLQYLVANLFIFC